MPKITKENELDGIKHDPLCKPGCPGCLQEEAIRAMPKITLEWEKEFDKRFGSLWSGKGNLIYGSEPDIFPDKWSLVSQDGIKSFIFQLLSQAQEEARKEGEKKWLAWAKGLLKEDVSGPNDCSGADYHLPACGGTCGEMLAEVDEGWNLRNFEITEAVEKLEHALSTSEEEKKR